jgi:Protein of unknown function (DUF4038)/Putative collagen-binding domain of a collagenase
VAILRLLSPRWSRVTSIVVALLTVALCLGVAKAPSAHARPSGQSRLQTQTAHSAAAPVFPLRVVSGKRYLVDSAGKPFLIVGDAAWSLIAQLKNDEVDRYLQDRRRKGFNAVVVNLLEHKFASNAPSDAYGDAPFTRPGDFSTPNPRYFDHVDTVIAKARAQGMLVLLTPAYLGFGGGPEGWWNEMRANGVDKLRQYGRYVGARYRRFDNVLWVEGGDYNPPPDGQKLVNAVAEGIRSAEPALQTFHGARETSALAYWVEPPPWLAVNTIYTSDSTVVPHAATEYRRSRMPFFLIEADYENESVKAAGVRQQAYQAILSGATGSVMGNRPIWLFDSGWPAALNSSGSRSMTPLAALFRLLPWWKLQPDLLHRLLVKGSGSGSTAPVAARAADGSFAVVYTPTSRALTVDLSRLRGKHVNVRWYDPVSGRFRPVPGSPFRAAGRRSFTGPATNAGGDGDFVLLLQSAR